MVKMYVEPYDKSYLGLACVIPKSEQNKVVLCKVKESVVGLYGIIKGKFCPVVTSED